MRLYLDIDETLLTKQGTLPEGAEEFLRWATSEHEAFWLSTRTRDGTSQGAEQAFVGLLPLGLVSAVQGVKWNVAKTEALPFECDDWVWIDDEIMQYERGELSKHGAEERFIQISLKAYPGVLHDIMRTITLKKLHADQL